MYHREYPIRCKSCNEQLACYSEEYEDLAREYGYEKALNMLNIMEPCSRYNMMNPVMILNIKENRNLIEGLKDIDVIDKSSEDYSFQSCEYNIGNVDYNKLKKKEEIKPEIELTTERNLSQMSITRKQPLQKSMYLSSEIKPVVTQNKPSFNVATKVKPPILSSSKQLNKIAIPSPNQQVNLIKEPTIANEDENMLESIKEPEKEIEFQFPTIVGIPTINSSGEKAKIHISGKYYAEVLSGRTYICR